MARFSPIMPIPSMAEAFLSETTVDDLMKVVIENILDGGVRITPTEGPAIELSGVLLELTNPRARLSRTETRGKAFSCLGELCWYLAERDDLQSIEYYVSKKYEERANDGRLLGAYGPRLFGRNGINQVGNIIDTLKKKEKRDSRQMVVQLFDANDLATKQRDVPCTCTLQFMIRRDLLILVVYMRSNDAFLGLPHDIFCFTMVQEIIAQTLDVGVGVYKHAVGSLHLYERDIDAAKAFLKEGFQPTKPIMPAMPVGDPWPNVDVLLTAEDALRNGRPLLNETISPLEPYWRDLIRLLQVFRSKKDNDLATIKSLRGEMSSDAYLPFIDKMIN